MLTLGKSGSSDSISGEEDANSKEEATEPTPEVTPKAAEVTSPTTASEQTTATAEATPQVVVAVEAPLNAVNENLEPVIGEQNVADVPEVVQHEGGGEKIKNEPEPPEELKILEATEETRDIKSPEKDVRNRQSFKDRKPLFEDLEPLPTLCEEHLRTYFPTLDCENLEMVSKFVLKARLYLFMYFIFVSDLAPF